MSNDIKDIVISPEALSTAVSEQLELYRKSVELRVDRCGAKAINELVRITKDTAPFDAKHHGRHYVDCIAKKREKGGTGTAVHTWYVKPPCHRLTHLLVKGHRITDEWGNTIGHADPNPFLKNARDKVLSEYEQDVIDAVINYDK